MLLDLEGHSLMVRGTGAPQKKGLWKAEQDGVGARPKELDLTGEAV